MKRVIQRICVIIISAALVLAFVVLIVREHQKRKWQAAENECARLRDLAAKYLPRLTVVSEEKVNELAALHAKAAEAYERRDLSAVREALEHMPEIVGQLSWEVSSKVDAPLAVPYNRTFLRAEQPLDFSDCSEFEKFMLVNLEIAMYFGGVESQRRDADALMGRDYLTYLCIRKYRDKFRSEKRKDLESLAACFLDRWVDQIESTNGLTRQSIREAIILNSDYAEARWPGRGWSREDRIRAARARTRGLINVGYTPKWLDVDYPDPDAKDNETRK